MGYCSLFDFSLIIFLVSLWSQRFITSSSHTMNNNLRPLSCWKQIFITFRPLFNDRQKKECFFWWVKKKNKKEQPQINNSLIIPAAFLISFNSFAIIFFILYYIHTYTHSFFLYKHLHKENAHEKKMFSYVVSCLVSAQV